MMRPMWMLGGGEWYSAVEDQYLFGSSLLVAPIYHPGATRRSVALPDGVWYGLLDGQRYVGGGHVLVDAPLDGRAVLVPAGSIVPMGDAMHYADEPGRQGFDNLELLIYPGEEAELTLYEDDGTTLAYERGRGTTTRIRWNDATRTASAEGETTLAEAGERSIAVTVMPGGERMDLVCRYIAG